jgi:hypothetical protein
MTKMTGGMSGRYNGDNNNVAFWAGGDFASAMATVAKYAQDHTYQPTDEELATMAKFVVTHGGRAILNDIILRGDIFATGGEFIGMMRKRKIIITDDNFDDYFALEGQEATYGIYTANLSKLGSFIEFNQGFTKPSCDILFPGSGWGSLSNVMRDKARSYVGNEVIIYNNSLVSVYTCDSRQCFEIKTKQMMHAKCTIMNVDGKEWVVWDNTIIDIM